MTVEPDSNSSSAPDHPAVAILSRLKVWRVPLGPDWRAPLFYLLLLAGGAFLAVSLLRPIFTSYDDWTRIVVNALADQVMQATDPVTVVIFGDEDLERLRLTYPIPYNAHAGALETILAYEPKAIFVDFLFLQSLASEELGENALVDFVCADERAGATRIYFPTPGASLMGKGAESDSGWLGAKLAGCANGAVLAPLDPHKSAGQLSYPAVVKDVRGNWQATPAFAIARDLNILDKVVDERLPTMEILWRSGLDRDDPTVEQCEPPGPGTALQALFKPTYVLKFCPTQPVVGAYRLLSGEMNEELRERRFRDRIVFYGGNFVGAADAVATPVGDYTPGVFVHAMAMQNLVSFKDSYKRNGGVSSLLYNAILALLAAVLAIGARNLGLSKSDPRPFLYPLGYVSLNSLPTKEIVYTVLLVLAWTVAFVVVGMGHTSAGVLAGLLAYLLWKTEGELMAWYFIVSAVAVAIAFYVLDLGAISAVVVIALLAITRKTDDLMCKLEEDFKAEGNRDVLGGRLVRGLARLVESTRPGVVQPALEEQERSR